MKRKSQKIKTNGVWTRETNMSYIFSQHFVTDISKAFKEKKFVQKVLPTKFSREFLGTNGDDLLTPNFPENDGSFQQIYRYNLTIL